MGKANANFNPDIDLIDFQPTKFLAFRDMEVCKRVAKIKKEDLCSLPKGTRPDFKAQIRACSPPARFFSTSCSQT